MEKPLGAVDVTVKCFKVRNVCIVHIWKAVCVRSIADFATIGDILEKSQKYILGFFAELFSYDGWRNLIL